MFLVVVKNVSGSVDRFERRTLADATETMREAFDRGCVKSCTLFDENGDAVDGFQRTDRGDIVHAF